MKTINLRGISEILCEKELKKVMGGAGPTKPTPPSGQEYSAAEEACRGSKLGGSCSMSWSGGSTSGTCGRNTRTGNLECLV